MQPRKRWQLFIQLLLAIAFAVPVATAQQLLDRDLAQRSISLKDLRTGPAEISGTVVNNTPHIVRDIEILVQYHWLWNNEFKPGVDNIGRTATVKLDKPLKAGEAAPFRYVPDPPLPARSDGRFEVEVSLGGFTVIIPQGAG